MRARAVNELAVGTRQGWTNKPMLVLQDRWSAVVFIAPGRCVAVMVMSKYAMKNHREIRRCITIVSFEEPLLIAATKPSLPH